MHPWYMIAFSRHDAQFARLRHDDTVNFNSKIRTNAEQFCEALCGWLSQRRQVCERIEGSLEGTERWKYICAEIEPLTGLWLGRNL